MAQRHALIRADDSLDGVCNFLAIDQNLATSGQPSKAQFKRIKAAGYKLVVNLAPTAGIENALADEAEFLAKLGMRYVHIPVHFANPTEADFAAFSQTMTQHAGQKVWVHCAANARVSAFVYRYRCARGENEKVARDDLHKIWRPVGVWRKFIARKTAK